MAGSTTRYFQIKIAGEESYIPIEEKDFLAIERALAVPGGVVRFTAAGSDEESSQSFVVPVQHIQHLCAEDVSTVIDLI